MDVVVDYTAASCNCRYNVLELRKEHNLVFYACKNNVAIYNLEDERVDEIGPGHKSRINCLRFIKDFNLDGESFGKDWLLTVDGNGELVIWAVDYLNERRLQIHLKKIIDKNANLHLCDGISLQNGSFLVATAGGDTKITIMSFSGETLESFQAIDLPYSLSLPMEITFHRFKDQLLFAIGLDRGGVLLYKKGLADTSQFTFVGELNKHEDWVRCIVFGDLENGDTLMASGGQDTFIAIWRLSKHSVKANEFEFQQHTLDSESNIFFDSMIIGHEGWINSLQFNPRGQLLSCSSDQSIIIWDNPCGEIWSEMHRFGVMGGQIPGGFGARMNEGGDFVLSWGFQGSISIWEAPDESEGGDWSIKSSVCGHFGAVSDLDYHQSGDWLLTCSVDQTSRVHSPIKSEDPSEMSMVRWHEIGRPQIHGYDLFAGKTHLENIVTGAEEKILRAFAPTELFQSCLASARDSEHNLVQGGGSVPALGLSNKFVEGPGEEIGNLLDEDFLRARSLWPEIAKLYGHAYEISCLATSPTHPLIASGSISSQTQFSAIILWSAQEWKHLGEYPHHKLNVIDLEFSPDGYKLLSCSRDRTWAVWRVIQGEGGIEFSLEIHQSGTFHTRALWVGTWASDSAYFVTGARDKKLAIWTRNEQDKFDLAINQTFDSPVSSASINPNSIIAVGLENGKIYLHQFDTTPKLTLLFTLDNSLAHTELVKRIRFNPKKDDEFASAGADHMVRVYRIVKKDT